MDPIASLVVKSTRTGAPDPEIVFQTAQEQIRRARWKEFRTIAAIEAEFVPVQKEYQRLQAEFLALRKRKEVVQHRLENYYQGQIDDAIVQYAKSASLLFAQHFEQSRCPREIRDKVYKHYWLENSSFSPSLNILLEQWQERCSAAGGPCSCTTPSKHHCNRPVILDPEYVGPAIAREALELWYFLEGPKPFPCSFHIGSYLQADALNLGVAPMGCLRRLKIQIDLKSLALPNQCSRKSSCRTFSNSIAANLEALECIRNKRGFRLTLELRYYEHCTTVARLGQVLDHLASTFHHFQASGAETRVMLTWVSWDNGKRAFALCMNKYFLLERSELEARLRSDFEAISTCKVY